MDIDPVYYNNQLQWLMPQGARQIDYPQGYHVISDASTYNYAPHPGYQSAQAYNYNTQQA